MRLSTALELIAASMVACTWLGDHQGRPSAPAIHRFKAHDIWRVTSRVIIIIIITAAVPVSADCSARQLLMQAA